jgi:hypothetical protein
MHQIDTHDEKEKKRCGFLSEEFIIPDDFDHMGEDEIENLFYGEI